MVQIPIQFPEHTVQVLNHQAGALLCNAYTAQKDPGVLLPGCPPKDGHTVTKANGALRQRRPQHIQPVILGHFVHRCKHLLRNGPLGYIRIGLCECRRRILRQQDGAYRLNRADLAQRLGRIVAQI